MPPVVAETQGVSGTAEDGSADRARRDLLDRSTRLLDRDRDRFAARLAAATPHPGAGRQLRDGVAEVRSTSSPTVRKWIRR